MIFPRDWAGQGSAVMPTCNATETDPPDWWDERSYDFTAQLMPRGWAWEFLRRNPAFQRDLLAALQTNNLSRGASVAGTRRPTICRAGMFCFAESQGRSAAVFWSPRRCANVLPVIAEQPSSSSTASPFELAALPCRAAVLLKPDKSQHVLLGNAERSLQIAVSGADIL